LLSDNFKCTTIKMASNEEKFCLKWNDFESNISVAFREIREQQDFLDCTLSCGSRQVQAHKLILSACSPFFRSILAQNPHQHPLLYLKGVEFSDLEAVLNFMYHGEVNVAQEELNSFLSVAEDLQVKGLTQNHSGPVSKKPAYHAAQEKPARQPKHASPPLSNPVYLEQQDDNILVMPMVKTEPEQISFTSTEVTTMQESYAGAMAEEEQEYEGQYLEMMGDQAQSKDLVSLYALKTENGKYSCTLCGWITRDKYNLRVHLEGKHDLSGGYNCDKCYRQLRTKQSLAQHRLHCFLPSS